MKMNKENIFLKLTKYRFEFRHLTLLFGILIGFQILISLVQKTSLQNFLLKTQEWYQKDSAERMANLTATSLELLIETSKSNYGDEEECKRRIVRSVNIILGQQLLEQSVEDVYIIISDKGKNYAIKDGAALYSFLLDDFNMKPDEDAARDETLKLYAAVKDEIFGTEETKTVIKNGKTFQIFVPLMIRGEYAGALYMKNTPDFTFITNEIIAGYDETVVIYFSLIFLGLLAMYYISSYTVRERDEAQRMFFQEHEKFLKEQIVYEKESLFTKRIYHTHHKAEKVMGFIKEDLKDLSERNIDETKYRIKKYANFISRVIYDMKWYDPPIQTIRNPLFRTDLNEVIRFLTQNIFLRVSNIKKVYTINLKLNDNVPRVSINEFVIWEILEPLIQNSIDHAEVENLLITIETKRDEDKKKTEIIIADNGVGIKPEFLEKDEYGTQKLFLENSSSKSFESRNRGYGCFIAYKIAKERCGWDLGAENIPEGGCRFIITILN